jgi:hypothetical protein
MRCVKVQIGEDVAIVCTTGRRVPKCKWCNEPSTKLCDFVVSSPLQITHRKTCDAPMCNLHAKCIGPEKDYCPLHVEREPGEEEVPYRNRKR